MKFFIDPGHGGSETGAVGNGIIEKSINLTVSLEVKRILESFGQTVVMSRYTDSTVSLGQRVELSNLSKADYFVSIHHNANDGKTGGAEVYHSVKGGKGKELAQLISDEFTKVGRTTKVLARESEVYKGTDFYYVIKHTNAPAIITEYAYIDSKDYINIDTSEELLMEANTIAKALLKVAGASTEKPKEVQHWAQVHYDKLKEKGIVIHETRFDDKITRGEVFALLAQLVK